MRKADREQVVRFIEVLRDEGLIRAVQIVDDGAAESSHAAEVAENGLHGAIEFSGDAADIECICAFSSVMAAPASSSISAVMCGVLAIVSSRVWFS